MKEDDVLRLLKALLEREQVEWAEELGWIRFRMRREAMIWEISCCARPGSLLIYGRFPFQTASKERGRLICDRINRELIRGALYLTENGEPVYRCRAELDDVYGAEERVLAALQYSAQVVSCFWGRLSGV